MGDGSSVVGFRRLLVVGEIAMALVLLVGAGLMITSLGRLLAVEPAFDPERLLVFEYSLPRSSPASENPDAFHDEVLERLRALPGVVDATNGCDVPLDAHCWTSGVRRIGDRVFGEGEMPSTGVHLADRATLSTLGIGVIAGRWFEPTDLPGGPVAVVITETAARRWFPDSSPLGQPFATGVSETTVENPGVIVGVIPDIRYDSPEQEITPEVFVSQQQVGLGASAVVLVRTAADPLALVPDVRATMGALDPDLPIYGVTTVTDLAAAHVSDSRALMGLLTLFAVVALLLAAVGIWGLVAYAVTRRRRELGIRMALGAEAGRVLRLVLRENLASAAAGVGLGIGIGLLAVRVMSGLLFEVQAYDPTVFAAGAGLLLAVAFVAAWLPARKVSQVDPLEAVRAE